MVLLQYSPSNTCLIKLVFRVSIVYSGFCVDDSSFVENSKQCFMHSYIKSNCDSVVNSVCAFHHTQGRIFSHNTKVITMDDTLLMMRVFYLIVRLSPIINSCYVDNLLDLLSVNFSAVSMPQLPLDIFSKLLLVLCVVIQK